MKPEIHQERDTMSQSGQIVSLQLCVGHREPMQAADSVKMITEFGFEGDRHATSTGARTARQVLLIDNETLEGFGLNHMDVRENVTVSGLDLHSMPEGQRLALGDDVVLEITGHCAPCERMDEIRPGLREELVGHRGMLTTVIQGGTVTVGDAIRVAEGATAV